MTPLGNITMPHAGDAGMACISVACTVTWRQDVDQPDLVCAALCAALDRIATAAASCTLNDAVFVTLWVPSMAQFAAVNAAYSTIMPALNPPARACVESPTDARCKLAVEVVLARQPGQRRVLHVQVLFCGTAATAAAAHPKRLITFIPQSISPWAPSCIGPYSQCVQYGGFLWMAGQIGLHPATMQLVDGGLAAQAAQALASSQVCRDVAG